MIDENCDFGEFDSTFLGESKVIIDELHEDGYNQMLIGETTKVYFRRDGSLCLFR